MTTEEKYNKVKERKSEFYIDGIVENYLPNVYTEPTMDLAKLKKVLAEEDLSVEKYFEIYQSEKNNYRYNLLKEYNKSIEEVELKTYMCHMSVKYFDEGLDDYTSSNPNITVEAKSEREAIKIAIEQINSDPGTRRVILSVTCDLVNQID